METSTETLWQCIETLLQAGKEPLARAAFRWSMEYAFLCGLKDAPCPVVITKYEDHYLPLRSHLDIRVERAWGPVAMSYRCNRAEVAKRRFISAVNNYYRYAIQASAEGTAEGDSGIWSINKWH
jgi:hypothetical protein